MGSMGAQPACVQAMQDLQVGVELAEAADDGQLSLPELHPAKAELEDVRWVHASHVLPALRRASPPAPVHCTAP
jgi:hypothetical protein